MLVRLTNSKPGPGIGVPSYPKRHEHRTVRVGVVNRARCVCNPMCFKCFVRLYFVFVLFFIFFTLFAFAFYDPRAKTVNTGMSLVHEPGVDDD